MMNKYDTKVMELATEGTIIYELTKDIIGSNSKPKTDFLLEGLLSFVVALKDVKKRDAYYLVIDGEKSKLVNIQRNLNVSHKDVTSAVQVASEKKSFEFEGQKYKLYRKIK